MKTNLQHAMLASSMALAMFTASFQANAESATQNITEARQETQIWTTYAISPYLRAHDLQVSVHNGKATLTGTVDEEVNKALAKQIALHVKGIKEVDNRIAVQPDHVPTRKTDERSYGDMIDDATITMAVKSKLLWSRYAEGLATEVSTESGKVTLVGMADSNEAKALAGMLATNTNGVIAVDNKLQVKSGKAATGKTTAEETGQDISDTWITTKVKTTFMYSKNISGSDISVTTTNGIVDLSGKVDSGAQRALAIELAKNVRGVKSVDAKKLSF